MKRGLCLVVGFLALRGDVGHAQPPTGPGHLSAPAAEGPAEPAAADAAPDVVHLTNGNRVRGYVAEDTAGGIVLIKEVRRGSFTRATFDRAKVARIVYAPEAARAAMKARIDWWDAKRQRDATAASRFPVSPSTEYPGSWEATGPYFRIVCDVNASTTRELATRLNTMYDLWAGAFRRRPRGAPPTTMFVAANLAGYRQTLARAGLPPHVANMSGGIYLPSSDVSVIPIQHADPREAQAWIQDVERRYAGRLTAAWDRQKRGIKSRLATDRARQIATAYHEGMHAFVHKELFPGQEAVPTWLNEGMASYVMMIREDAEGLRTQALNPFLYPTVVAALARGSLPPIRNLVTRAESIMEHDTNATAKTFYAASWSLVYFLNIERGALGTDMYARYVDALEAGTDATAAFEEMTGETLAVTNGAWRRAIRTWK